VATVSEAQRLALLVAYGLITSYYIVALYAAWVRPQLQRIWLLRPRWRGGVPASQFGVTAQAVFAFSLSAFGASKLFNAPFSAALGFVCLAAAVLRIVAWAADALTHPN
jgi:hypothetical protein